jgi:predicted metalloprotease
MFNSISARTLLAVALALALAVAVGACGDDDETTSGTSGTEVTVNEPVTADVDEPDADATQEPPQGEETLGDFEELRTAEDTPDVPAIRGSAGLSTEDWIHTVDGDVASYWQQQFNNAGYRFKPAKELIFDNKLKSACGVKASLRTGPFYCTTDEAIYFPIIFFQKVPEKFGDAATAVVVAHENAHRVQDLIGLFDTPGIISAQLELQADCLAGVWAKTVYSRGLLEEGDIGEILGVTDLAGDPENFPINAPGAHGNSQMRIDAFNQGYDGGSPDSCPVPSKKDIKRAASA